ncbi:MAG: transposase [Bacteriovoracaceae bacterium]|nr:transposase [Bacteriovoracaceae bacterium]
MHSLSQMPRPLRIRQYEFPYSVTTRCNNKEFYLQNNFAYRVFETVFKKLKNCTKDSTDPIPKYQFEIHHLEVMSNHYHLILSVSAETPIDLLMQQINSMVARILNKFLKRTGHFWEGRYKSKILNSLDYLQRSIAYVYQNPLKAKITKELFRSARSTIRFYWKGFLPWWVTPDPFFSSVSPTAWKKVLENLILKPDQIS